MDQVWKIVYDSFEHDHLSGFRTAAAINPMRSEVQFRLQKNIAAYKQNPNEETLDAIEADVQLCGSLGFITDETVTKVLEIIDKQGN